MYKIYLLLVGFIMMGFAMDAQNDVITLNNPSFEDSPHAGGNANIIKDWQDCGVRYFPGETAPDIHLGMARDTQISNQLIYFGVKQPASQGFSFLGFVVRSNDSYESVSQRLEKPIESGKCYSFSIDLSRSLTYTSPYPPSPASLKYTKPTVLRIYGGSSYCGKRELLAESSPVSNSDWQTYDFTFEPSQTHRYFTISAFYKVPVLFAYNGNLLIDNASDIKQIPCPDEEIVAEEKPVEEKPTEKPVAKVKKDPPVKVTDPEVVVAATPKPEEKPRYQPKMTINRELDRKYLKKGQTIKIKNLYFDADSIVINSKSRPALLELSEFLKYNNDIQVEIGGHTNGKPPAYFCDSLSEARAKNVAQFLYNKGIPQNQITYKGYGKTKPIATNKTPEGRRRNQRVEIKVLDIGASNGE